MSAQLAAEMAKRRGQGWNIWRPTLGLVDQGGDEARYDFDFEDRGPVECEAALLTANAGALRILVSGLARKFELIVRCILQIRHSG